MPTLDPDDEARIVREMDWTCPKCHKRLNRRYCNRCDEVYFLCDCPPEPREDHRSHAAGRW